MRLLITVAAAAASFAILTSVVAAGADVRVTALDCESHPRRIRIENVGDAAQDLSGWQLQTHSGEGGPFDLGQIGSLDAGKKAFVFQGHLSPATDPVAGYYRWGSGEIFNLRANDSTDYVRIVDPQGNTINQRNCEGLPPGATPAPTSEYDPPPLVTPVVTAPPVVLAPTATTPAAPAVRAGSSLTTTGVGALPAGGGPPSADQRVPVTLPLAAGVVTLAAGIFLVTLGLRRREPGS
jgi:hypothetical protein